MDDCGSECGLIYKGGGKVWTWVDTYLHRKLSTYVLKINIFNIGKLYGVNNKTCLIAI